MTTVEEVWERLKSIDDLAAKDPLEGRKAADVALDLLAGLTDPPHALLAFGAQIDGTAWRANGGFAAAERCYMRAEGIYREALAACQAFAMRRQLILGHAGLYRRWSFLCLELCDWNRGLKMLDFAEERFTAAGQRHELGCVHLARGQLLWEREQQGDQDRALKYLSWAIEMVAPETSEAVFEAAEHNLTWAITLHPNPAPESLEKAFRALQRSRLSAASKRPSNRHRERQRFGHVEHTVPDAKRRCLQGKVLLRLYQHDEARPFLESSLADLIELGGYPRDVFAVALDLVECYLWVFRRPWRKVSDLLAETLALCPVRDLAPEVEAALELFQVALEARRLEAARKHLDTVRRRYADVPCRERGREL